MADEEDRKIPAPPTADEENRKTPAPPPTTTTFDAPPAPYVPQGLYLPQIYWHRPENVVLRVLQLVFSLVAFSVMADVLNDAYNNIESFKYALAIGVLAFLYALAQLSFSLWSLMRGGPASTVITPLYQYGTFIMDQITTYFLISSGTATAANIRCINICDGTNFCSRLTGCVTLLFFAFLAFAASSLLTGYHLVKCILKA